MSNSQSLTRIKEQAEEITKLMQQSSSEIAHRATVELMLTDHSTVDVIEILRTTAQFLEDRQ